MVGYGAIGAHAQSATDSFYVPLIGITSVPDPFALPKGAGSVTYRYAVKNFLQEAPLTAIQIVDTACSPIKFVTGDDNNDAKLDYSETWRYECVTKLATTTSSVATVSGTANGMIATHNAYATVVVGSDKFPPLVSIVNITKVAYPLSLPPEGGPITFTYRVNNPGVVPLGGVTVVDDKCSRMSGKLGDTNGNNQLDVNEVWIYTCTTILKQTTTNAVTVTAYANNLKATDTATITVKVATEGSSTPGLPDTGTTTDPKALIWGILALILVPLAVTLLMNRYRSRTDSA